MTDTINHINHDMIDKLAYKGQGISKEDLRTEHENEFKKS